MTPPPAGDHRRFRRVIILVATGAVLVIALVLTVTAVSFVHPGSFRPGSSDSSLDTVVVRDDRVAFDLNVPQDVAISTIDTNEMTQECPMVSYRFTAAGLVVEAVSTDCAVPEDQRIDNGNHGIYRTIEDVPEPVDVARVETFAGPADVFTQSYTEYTNVTDQWDEPVAIVVLDEPVDAEYPTLVLRSNKGELDRAAFTELVKELSIPTT